MSEKARGVTKTVTAADVTAGTIDFFFGDVASQIKGSAVSVKAADGTVKAWDGKHVVSGAKVTVDNTGAVDWADTDVITVTVH